VKGKPSRKKTRQPRLGKKRSRSTTKGMSIFEVLAEKKAWKNGCFKVEKVDVRREGQGAGGQGYSIPTVRVKREGGIVRVLYKKVGELHAGEVKGVVETLTFVSLQVEEGGGCG